MTPDSLTSVMQFLPELILTIVAIFIMLADFFVPRQRDRFPILAAAGMLIALYYSTTSFGRSLAFLPPAPRPPIPFAGAIVIDAWTDLFRIAAQATATVALLLGIRAKKVGGDYAILILLSTIGVATMAASRDFLVTVIGLEIMSLALYPLIAVARTRGSYEASIKYFLMGAVASAVMLFGISFIFGETGTTRYLGMQAASGRILVGFVLLTCGFFFKIAAVPFQAWLPDVYETTPASLGGFMAAAVKMAGFAALGRVLVLSIPLDSSFVTVVMLMSVITMTLGNTGALFQSNFARMMGYSAIAHTGFLLMGVAATAKNSNPAGLMAVAFYLLTYAPAVIGAFIVAGMMDVRSGHRRMSGLEGLFSRHPISAIALTILMASMAGLPPTGGFWAKFDIFVATYETPGFIGLLLIGVLNSLFAAYYYVRVIKAIFTSNPVEVAELPSSGGALERALLLLAALFILGVGIWPGPLVKVAAQAALSLGGLL